MVPQHQLQIGYDNFFIFFYQIFYDYEVGQFYSNLIITMLTIILLL